MSGSAGSSGAAVLQLTNSTLNGNRAVGKAAHGGAISGYFVNLTVSNSTLSENSVSVADLGTGPFDRVADITPFGRGTGGAIFLVLSAATFDTLTQACGAFCMPSAFALRFLFFCVSVFVPAPEIAYPLVAQVADNNASRGGGVFITGNTSTVSLSAARFTRNAARDVVDGRGGALFLDAISSFSAVSGTMLTNNSAAISGGAVYATGVSGVISFVGVTGRANRCVATTLPFQPSLSKSLSSNPECESMA